MKTITTLIFASILTLSLAGSKVCSSQTVVIGHVSAEVVEAVSASSTAITSFEIGAVAASDAKSLEQTFLTSETVGLGAITIQSGKDVTCNVVLKSASMSDSLGNGFTLEPTIKNDTFASAAQPNGTQTLQLDGKASMARNQASGLYQGSYTVVFAYN